MSQRLAVPFMVLGITAASAMALAAVETKVGSIKSLDSAKHELVLSTGETFELPNSVQLKTLKVGEKVSIAYEVKNGKMMATKVSAAREMGSECFASPIVAITIEPTSIHFVHIVICRLLKRSAR